MPSSFPFTKEIEVVFRDIDAMGHVNNAVYITYLETTRITYIKTLFDLPKLTDVPIVMGDVYCRYISPALYGERLSVGIGVSRWGRKSFDFVNKITAQDGRIIAVAKTVMVAYDYSTQTSILIPDWFRTKIDAFQQGWQPPKFNW